MNNSGFNSFGKPVPSNRMMKGYETIKEICPDISTEKTFSIIQKCCIAIEKDRPFDIIGNPTAQDAMKQWISTGHIKNKELDNDIADIDLTGRYRLLATLLTD